MEEVQGGGVLRYNVEDQEKRREME